MNAASRCSYSKHGNGVATPGINGASSNESTVLRSMNNSTHLDAIPIIISFRHPQDVIQNNSRESLLDTSIREFSVRNIISKKDCDEKVPIFCRKIIENFASSQWLYSICRPIYLQQDGDEEEYYHPTPLNIRLDFGDGCFTTVLLRRHDHYPPPSSSSEISPRKVQLSITLNIKESSTCSYIMSPLDTIRDQLSTISYGESLSFTPHFEVVIMNTNNQFIGTLPLDEENEGRNSQMNHIILLTIKDDGEVGIARRLRHESDYYTSSTSYDRRLKRGVQDSMEIALDSSDVAKKPSARKKRCIHQSSDQRNTTSNTSSTSSRNNILENLNDDVISTIFDFCYGEKDDVLMPLRRAMDIASHVGSLSKSMIRLCISHIKNFPIDANFYQFETNLSRQKILPIILWMIQHQLKLGKLDIQCAEYDFKIMIHLLRCCDTTMLQHCGILHTRSLSSHIESTNYSIISSAWDFKCQSHDPISLETFMPIPLEEQAISMGVPHDIVMNDEYVSVVELQQSILEQAPSLKSLRLRLSKDNYLLPFPTVDKLNLSANIGYSTDLWRHLTDTFHKMPKLTHLTLASVHGGISIQIKSKSLTYINVLDCGKSFWVSHCECPMLKSFICRATCYGNGVRPVLPSTTSPEMFMNRADISAMQVCHKDIICEGMLVPDTCIITFDP